MKKLVSSVAAVTAALVLLIAPSTAAAELVPCVAISDGSGTFVVVLSGHDWALHSPAQFWSLGFDMYRFDESTGRGVFHDHTDVHLGFTGSAFADATVSGRFVIGGRGTVSFHDRTTGTHVVIHDDNVEQGICGFA